MVVGTVAEVLEDVAGLDEGGLPNPVRTLPAHVGVGDVAAVHVGRHEVAPYPALGAASLRHPGRGVVGAPRAEVRGARHREDLTGAGLARLRVEERDAIVDDGRGVEMGDAGREGARHVVGRDLREAGEQHPSRLVLVPDDPRAAPVGERIEGVADLQLGEGHLLLDDEELFEAVREPAHRFRVERIRHRDLEHRDPELVRGAVVDPQVEERLADVVPGLAGGDDSVAGPPAREGHPVEPVRPRIRHRGVELPVPVAGLHLVPEVRDAEIEPARGRLEVGRKHGLGVEGVRGQGRARVHRVRHRLVAHPRPREARERDAVEAVAQHLAHGGGIEEGHHHLDEGELVGGGRVGGGEGVVVADHDEHPSVAGAARHVAVADRVHAPIEPRSLAVPQGEDAVVPAVAERRRLLAAPDRSGREVLVDGRLEVDTGAREEALGGPQLLVDVVHRGAAVAGDVAGGVEAGLAVADALHHREAHDRLAPGDVDPPFPALVLVVQGNRGKLHGHSPSTVSGRARTAIAPRRVLFASGSRFSAQTEV